MSDFLVFRTENGSIDPVRVMRGSAAPKITSGAGGWDVVDRPKRKSLTLWNGYAPTRMDVSILFEGWHARASQEQGINRLIKMSLPPSLHHTPPVVLVGPELPVLQVRWVIEGIDWGDNIIYGDAAGGGGDSVRLRQDGVVHLLEFVAAETITAKASPVHDNESGKTTDTGKPNPNGTPRWYYGAAEGDSLYAIAVKFYGNRNWWDVIAEANGLRDPILTQDMTLKIP